MKAAEEARRELEAATVAFAQPGQMQAERDLNMQGGKTSPVQIRGRYGRRAADWFSFDLPVDPASPLALVVTYNRDERADRAFAVLVDGRKVGEERIARRSPQEKEGFFDVSYGLPGRGRRRQDQGHGPVRGGRRPRNGDGVRHPRRPGRQAPLGPRPQARLSDRPGTEEVDIQIVGFERLVDRSRTNPALCICARILSGGVPVPCPSLSGTHSAMARRPVGLSAARALPMRATGSSK